MGFQGKSLLQASSPSSPLAWLQHSGPSVGSLDRFQGSLLYGPLILTWQRGSVGQTGPSGEQLDGLPKRGSQSIRSTFASKAAPSLMRR